MQTHTRIMFHLLLYRRLCTFVLVYLCLAMDKSRAMLVSEFSSRDTRRRIDRTIAMSQEVLNGPFFGMRYRGRAEGTQKMVAKRKEKPVERG